MESKEIRVTYHHEDSGFCRTTFKEIDGKRYFNRHDDGGWYITHPYCGYWESDYLINPEVVFVVCTKDGRELCRDSNGEQSAFLLSPSENAKRVAKVLARQYDVVDYQVWKKALLEEKEKAGDKDYDENWLYCRTEELDRSIIKRFEHLGIKYTFEVISLRHTIAAVKWLMYEINDDIGNCVALVGTSAITPFNVQ